MGLIVRGDDGLRVSADAAAYLTRGTPGSLWGLVDMEVDHFLSPRALMDALEKDDSSVYGEADPWEAQAGAELADGYVVDRVLGTGATARAFLVERDGHHPSAAQAGAVRRSESLSC